MHDVRYYQLYHGSRSGRTLNLVCSPCHLHRLSMYFNELPRFLPQKNEENVNNVAREIMLDLINDRQFPHDSRQRINILNTLRKFSC